MKIINEAKISFLSKSVNESFVRIAVSGFIAGLDPNAEELADIKTALSEAVTNSIVHGYKDIVGKIDVLLRIIDGNVIYIKVRDYGCGIEDIEKAKTPLFTTDPEGERAGLGFAVMESFMDKLVIKSKSQRGTTVIMSRKIKSKNLED